MKATMVEFLNNSHAWTWYRVYKTKTPEEALKEYAFTHDLKYFKISEENNEFYLGYEARAYQIEIE